MLFTSICIKKSSTFTFNFWLFLVLLGWSTLVTFSLLLLVQMGQSVVEGSNHQSSENSNIGQLCARWQILDRDTQKFHLISLLSSCFLLLFSLSFFLSNLVFLIKLFNEFCDLILLFICGKIIYYFTIVHAVKEREKSCRIELLALYVELDRKTSTDWTSCWVIYPSHFSTATA